MKIGGKVIISTDQNSCRMKAVHALSLLKEEGQLSKPMPIYPCAMALAIAGDLLVFNKT